MCIAVCAESPVVLKHGGLSQVRDHFYLLGRSSMTTCNEPLVIEGHQTSHLPPAPLALAYKFHVATVLFALAVFFAFYLAILAGAAYVLYALLRAAHVFDGGLVFWALFGASLATTLVVFLFLLKG